ncbi:MAG: Fic family protein [Actinomycetota bacterium]|nr:Fic family protein [Actinomycetota bacterium]
MTMRGDWTLDELRAGLDGSPYSIPSASDQSATQMLDQLRLVTAEATTARHNLHKNYRVRLKDSRRSREIHESNRVEYLGPEFLADTHRILRSKQADDIEEAINRFTLIRSLDADQRTLDVLGLHGAKSFADQLLASPSAHLAETDVRDIHGLLMGKDYRGGAYKGWLNEIGDSEHVPHAPSDTPEAMHELMTWMNRVIAQDCLPAPVAAAAVHAWLAHIHPFHDGNGRVSRLLANLIAYP